MQLSEMDPDEPLILHRDLPPAYTSPLYDIKVTRQFYRRTMKTSTRTYAVGLLIVLLGMPAAAQRPSDPALLVPQTAPELDYVSVPEPFSFPAGVTFNGAPAAVEFDAKGHLFVVTRGNPSLYEFDANGKFVRSFVEGLFTRTHGLRIDKDGNFWVADTGAHTVVKLDPQGKVLMTIGTKGQRGDWNDATQLLYEPNDIAIAGNGDVFVAQGHAPGANGNPRVLKFDKNGKFIKSWGGKGKEPGKFDVAHGAAFDAKGQLWVTDRENQRIQVFDTDGKFIKELKFAGLPCSLDIGPQNIYMVNGFAGQLVKMDLDGKVLAAIGKPGKGLGEFGEAHVIAVSPAGVIYVADSVNATVQKFVKK
jgi:DNA-binding beta-propeller fold protein YncE